MTVEGVPVELVVADPGGLGTALLRATGSPEYVADLEPLPDAARRGGRLRRAGHPVAAARAARAAVPRRASGTRGAGRHPRRPALPHDLVRRPRERRGDGPQCDRARLRVPRDLRPHPRGRRRARAHRRRGAPPGRGDRRRQRGARAVPRAARDRVRHPHRRPARSPRRRAGRARLGPGERPRRPADARARADQAGRGGAAQPVGALPQPPQGPHDRPPAGERARPRAHLRGRARGGRRARGERAAEPARPERRPRARGPPGGRADRLLDRRPLPARARQHGAVRRDRAARLGGRRRTC